MSDKHTVAKCFMLYAHEVCVRLTVCCEDWMTEGVCSSKLTYGCKEWKTHKYGKAYRCLCGMKIP